MIITICIGSSCHLKGSREIVKTLQDLISSHHLHEKVELNGSFCIGNCVNGVCVKIDDTVFSLSPKDATNFFHEQVLTRI